MLSKIVKKGVVKKNISGKKLTTFKIGGKVSTVVEPFDEQEFIVLINELTRKKKKHVIMGNGSNILISDKGYSGIVIKTNNINSIELIDDNVVRAYTGASLFELCSFCAQNNLSGFEGAYGIPATVGGAVKMNASAYDFCMQNVVVGVMVIKCGIMRYITNEQCEFDYRASIFDSNNIVLYADFKLERVEDSQLIYQKMNQTFQKRKDNQPLNYPSAGSVFKRKQGVIVSKMLDEMGFKGVGVGDAMVSKKHCGFIINLGKAKCSDVLSLIDLIKRKVKDKNGIDLEEEIVVLE